MRRLRQSQDHLGLRLFLLVFGLPMLSFELRRSVLNSFGYPVVSPDFFLYLKFCVVLFAIWTPLWLIIRRRNHTEAMKGAEVVSANWQLAAWVFVVLTLGSNLANVSYLSIFLPIDAAIAISLITGNYLLLVFLVMFSTMLGNKGALFFLLVFVFLRDSLTMRQVLGLIASMPILAALYLLGRVVTASIFLEGGFSFSAIASLYFQKASDPATIQFLMDSISKRLNQYDGVEFVIRTGVTIDQNVFDPMFLINRLIDSFTPGGASVKSFGVYIGELMNPAVSFKTGFAGALGMLGQLTHASVTDIAILLMLVTIMAYAGTALFSRLPGKRSYLLFVSMAFTPLIMSGNLDTVLVLFFRSAVGIIILMFIYQMIRVLKKVKIGDRYAQVL